MMPGTPSWWSGRRPSLRPSAISCNGPTPLSSARHEPWSFPRRRYCPLSCCRGRTSPRHSCAMSQGVAPRARGRQADDNVHTKQSHLLGSLCYGRRRLRAADEATGERSCRLALARDDLTRDQCGKVAFGALDEAAAATGQVVNHLRRVDVQPIVIDDIDVGLGAAANDAAVVEPDGPGVVAC